MLYRQPGVHGCEPSGAVETTHLLLCWAGSHLLKSRSSQEFPGSPGKSQKEGQEDQGKVKELGGDPPYLF